METECGWIMQILYRRSETPPRAFFSILQQTLGIVGSSTGVNGFKQQPETAADGVKGTVEQSAA